MITPKDETPFLWAVGTHRASLPLLPLKDIVIFPHMMIPVFVSEDLCVQAVESAMAKNRLIFLSAFQVMTAAASDQTRELVATTPAPFDVYDVGTVCQVVRTRRLPDGRVKVLVQGICKARVLQLESQSPYPVIAVEPFVEDTPTAESESIAVAVRNVKEYLEKVVALGKVLSPDILMVLEDVKEADKISDIVAANLGLRVEDAQKILANPSPLERLEMVHRNLAREVEVFQMQVKIQSQAKEEIGKMQREHFLREQIRALKNELGENESDDDAEELWKKLDAAQLPEDVRLETTRQLRRLERMHQDASEAILTRNHIETLLQMPWSSQMPQPIDIHRVRDVLGEDHFGLEQVKERIIEYMAVQKLNPEAQAPILCFVGPPGVGKTSFGKSIAKALGRPFVRISLGGVRDEAEVRGHRKTYVGAYPGRIMQALRQAGSAHPVVMLDEIDKLGNDHRGDPAAALLEVLDPEQNHSFIDHYLGVPFNLSRVIFIANANTLETLHPALRDRLEIIEVSGYSEEDKIQIARRFMVPRLAAKSGLGGKDFAISRASLVEVIRGYTRESGLRGLEKVLAAVFRKMARYIAEEQERTGGHNRPAARQTQRLTPANVARYLGPQRYPARSYPSDALPGLVLGLAYTQSGGEVLAIEALLSEGSGKLQLTGQLGDVMKESAQAALSYLVSRGASFGIPTQLMQKRDVHLHLPQGAIPKDGPSAGIAITSAILSAFLGVAPRTGVCMSGEITILGKVLPVGGLKEKILAAQREGLHQVILPEANRCIVDQLAPETRKRLQFVYVSEYREVFPVLFGDVAASAPSEAVRRARVSQLAG